MRKFLMFSVPVLLVLTVIIVSCSKKTIQPAIKPTSESGIAVVVDEIPPLSVLWKEISIADPNLQEHTDSLPSKYKIFRLDVPQMKQLLKKAVADTVSGKVYAEKVDLPMPDGTLMTFNISENLTMSKALLQKFPGLRTYGGKSLQDPTASVKLDFIPSGFHAYIFSEKGSVIIKPYTEGDLNNYLCFYKNYSAAVKQPFEIPADSIK